MSAPVDALDTAKVAPAAGTFSERVAPCGCRGVPDGQHVADRCGSATRSGMTNVSEAPMCSACHYRGVTYHGVCPFCGTPRR